MHAIKKDLHYLILLKEQHILFLFTYFQDTKKYLIKTIFNGLKIMLEQRLNESLNQHYRQVVVYIIRLCVYWLESN